MPEPLRICCVTASLTAGGAQRVMATMTDYWVARDHDVTFVTLSDRESDFFPLRPGTHRVALELLKDSRSLRQAVSHNWERVRELRETIRQSRADVVISFLNTVNVLTIFAARGLGIPVVVSERNNPWQITMGYPWRVLRRLSYPRAAALVVQTEVGKEWADRITDPKKAVVIPNPISERFARLRGHEHTSRRPVVLAMGKLHPQKGFDVLIDAFAQVAARHPSWTLVIAGKGDEEAKLKNMAAEMLPAGRVEFPGVVDEPERHLLEAGLFVLSSRYEGFPNVLLEAMACQCAVISTDCPTGPSEIVTDDVDGVLVAPEDPEALARQMDRLMSSEPDRRRMGARAGDVIDRFNIDRIMSQWESVLDQVIRKEWRNQ